MKLWAGRFQKETDDKVNDFNSSISFDARLYRQDITGSIAHATMLGEQGIIAKEEAEKIVTTLKTLLEEIEEGKVEFTKDSEDIHMNMEVLLTQRIGATGKRLHTARSRNDQVALDFRLFVKEEIPVIVGMLLDLEKALLRQAESNLDAIMPGYTHLQRAQPITFAHAMMAYANMFRRDITRLEDCRARLDESPLGSGALATSTHPVDRFRTADLLGFSKPMDNSLLHPDDAPVPVLGGAHSLVQLGVSVHHAGRRLRHRLLHHAPEEKPRRSRAGPGKNRAGIRRPHHPAHGDERHPPGL